MADSDTSPNAEKQAAIPDDTLSGIIDRANRLLDAQGGSMPARLNFGWRGVEFKIERTDEKIGVHHISIEAHLGYVPYSAENAAGRKEALKLVCTSTSPTGGRLFQIGRDGGVSLKVACREEDLSSLPEMLKRISQRVLELSDKLENMRAALTF